MLLTVAVALIALMSADSTVESENRWRPVDPLSYGNPAFCEPKGLVRDFGLSRLPAVSEPPESGELPFGPRAIQLWTFGGPVLLTGQSFGYHLSGEGYGRPKPLGWTVRARLSVAGPTGKTGREVDSEEVEIRMIDVADEYDLALGPLHRPGFYRYDIEFLDSEGEILGSYSEYIKVFERQFWKVRLGLSGKSFRVGERVLSRVENLGTEIPSFGEEFQNPEEEGGRLDPLSQSNANGLAPLGRVRGPRRHGPLQRPLPIPSIPAGPLPGCEGSRTAVQRRQGLLPDRPVQGCRLVARARWIPIRGGTLFLAVVLAVVVFSAGDALVDAEGRSQPSDPFTFGSPAFCESSEAVGDFGFAGLPAVRNVPESGDLPFGPKTLSLQGSDWGVRYLGEKFGYALLSSNYAGRTPLGWTLRARMLLVGPSGEVGEEVAYGQVKVRRIGSGDDFDLYLSPPRQRGMYRYDFEIVDSGGERLATYSSYVSVFDRFFWEPKLGLDREEFKPGQAILSRVENFGTETVHYGDGFIVQRSKGERWIRVPDRPGRVWALYLGVASAGSVGRCSAYRLARDAAPGEYRAVKEVERPSKGGKVHYLTATFTATE